jgi:hypothetical protein
MEGKGLFETRELSSIDLGQVCRRHTHVVDSFMDDSGIGSLIEAFSFEVTIRTMRAVATNDERGGKF